MDKPIEFKVDIIPNSITSHPDGSHTTRCILSYDPDKFLQEVIISSAEQINHVTSHTLQSLIWTKHARDFDGTAFSEQVKNFGLVLSFYENDCKKETEIPCTIQEPQVVDVTDNIASLDDVD